MTKVFIGLYTILILLRLVLYMNLWAKLQAFSGSKQEVSWIGDFLASYMTENIHAKIWLSLILIFIFFACFMVNLFALKLSKKIKDFASQSVSRKSHSASVDEEDYSEF